ncbi:hypothetical protein TNCV_271951 [Trichonephila clavipes]|nr:hypothetical protein TNCV_271951 [Trichonephila clavipes]
MGKEELLNIACHVRSRIPVKIWLMAGAEGMRGPYAQTPQRCSSGWSLYQQCELEGCGSKIQYHPKP